MYASQKQSAHLDNDAALHLVPAVHVDPEHDGDGPGPDSVVTNNLNYLTI